MDTVLEMCPALAQHPVATGVLSLVDCFDARREAHPEHVEPVEQVTAVVVPLGMLEHVLDDQRVSGLSEGCNRAMETIEERRPQGLPFGILSISAAQVGEYAACDYLIR